MALTDTRIRNAKPKPKPYKLSDGGGMYLLIMPSGARYWRWTIGSPESAAPSHSVSIPKCRSRMPVPVVRTRGLARQRH